MQKSLTHHCAELPCNHWGWRISVQPVCLLQLKWRRIINSDRRPFSVLDNVIPNELLEGNVSRHMHGVVIHVGGSGSLSLCSLYALSAYR